MQADRNIESKCYSDEVLDGTGGREILETGVKAVFVIQFLKIGILLARTIWNVDFKSNE